MSKKRFHFPTVLIVDDNPGDRGIIRRVVDSWDFEVKEASNAFEAFDILENEIVDIVLLDLYMPLLNGIETVQQIRKQERWRDLPVIMVSAASSRQAEECYRAGADYYLRKPWNPELLRLLMSACASEKHSED